MRHNRASLGFETMTPSERSCRVLVVEDEGIVALDIAHTLERLGYDVVARVSSGEEAIRKAPELRADLVLMDIHLSGQMDGIHAAKEIRSAMCIPVVFLTAFADVGTLRLAVGAEAGGYVTKPYGEVQLHCAIEVALSQHRLEVALREKEELFRDMSLIDDLTGLQNRRGFMHLAAPFLKQAHRSEQHVVLLFMDLDRFKQINDDFGHAIGDEALREAGSALRRSTRNSDIVARLGGDEFVVLAAGKGPTFAGVLRERIALSLNHANATNDHSFMLAMSTGQVTVGVASSATIDQLLEEADRDMYAAKRARAIEASRIRTPSEANEC